MTYFSRMLKHIRTNIFPDVFIKPLDQSSSCVYILISAAVFSGASSTFLFWCLINLVVLAKIDDVSTLKNYFP